MTTTPQYVQVGWDGHPLPIDLEPEPEPVPDVLPQGPDDTHVPEETWLYWHDLSRYGLEALIDDEITNARALVQDVLADDHFGIGAWACAHPGYRFDELLGNSRALVRHMQTIDSLHRVLSHTLEKESRALETWKAALP